MQMVGTQNAHNLITSGTDRLVWSWLARRGIMRVGGKIGSITDLTAMLIASVTTAPGFIASVLSMNPAVVRYARSPEVHM